jgi:hypothetical protein
MTGLIFIGKPENKFKNYLDTPYLIESQNTIDQHSKPRVMDTIAKDDIKSKLNLLKDEIIHEAIDKTYWQLTIKRDGGIVNIRQRENDSFCEVWFWTEYEGDDLIKLKGFSKDQQFLLELRKLLTTPITFFYFNIQNEEFHGFYIISKCFIDSNSINIEILDRAIRTVINYGVLGISFINSKIRRESSEQQTKTVFPDENKSYS